MHRNDFNKMTVVSIVTAAIHDIVSATRYPLERKGEIIYCSKYRIHIRRNWSFPDIHLPLILAFTMIQHC